MKYKLKLHKKFFLIIIFLLTLNPTYAFSEIIKKIEVFGNERLSSKTVILFSELDLNDDISSYELNDSFKKLFETNYFKDINITFVNGLIKINVVENPIIQTININGIKNKSILSELEKVTKKSEKYPYLKNKINDQKNLLINIIRAEGFYFAEIETKIEDNLNNSVNVVYNFNLGKRAKINEIKFIGNKKFKNNKLRNIIVSEESKPWKFLTSNKYLNENRIKLDKNLLVNYFRNKGYYKVKVKSSSAKVINEDKFVLIFNIDSG